MSCRPCALDWVLYQEGLGRRSVIHPKGLIEAALGRVCRKRWGWGKETERVAEARHVTHCPQACSGTGREGQP